MILNIITSLFIPLSIPIIIYLLSKPDLGGNITVKDNDTTSIKFTRNTFLAELPSAYITNSVWGATYTTIVSIIFRFFLCPLTDVTSYAISISKSFK